jgi:hypothetical protein
MRYFPPSGCATFSPLMRSHCQLTRFLTSSHYDVGTCISCHGRSRRIKHLQGEFAHKLSRDSRIRCQFPPRFAHTLTKSSNDIDSSLMAGAGKGPESSFNPDAHHQRKSTTLKGRPPEPKGFPPPFTNVTTLNAHQL